MAPGYLSSDLKLMKDSCYLGIFLNPFVLTGFTCAKHLCNKYREVKFQVLLLINHIKGSHTLVSIRITQKVY